MPDTNLATPAGAPAGNSPPPPPPPPSTETPLLAGKYKTPQELETAYKELESKLGSRPPAAPANPKTSLAEPQTIPDDADIATVLKTAGVTQDELQEQWMKNGKLTDEQYAKFKNIGVMKATVNEHMKIAAQAAAMTADLEYNRAVAAVGGEDKLNTLKAWASSGMDRAELLDLNNQVKTGKLTFSNYMRLLESAHIKAVGAGGIKPLVNGAPARPQSAPTTPKEINELVAAAARGDEAAIERLKGIPPTEWADGVTKHMNG